MTFTERRRHAFDLQANRAMREAFAASGIKPVKPGAHLQGAGDADYVDADDQVGAGPPTQFQEEADATGLTAVSCGNPACRASLVDAEPGAGSHTAVCKACGQTNSFGHLMVDADDTAGVGARDLIDCIGCGAVYLTEGLAIVANCPQCRYPFSTRSFRRQQRRALKERATRSARR